MSLFFSYKMLVDKAYIIKIKGHENSEIMAKRCSDSCDKVGMPYEYWDAYDGTGDQIILPEHHNIIMDMIKITNHHLTKPEICCCLSHISLWAKCILQDQPLVILEHDAVMVAPYIRHEIFNSIAYLGCLEQANGWAMHFTPPHGTDGPNNHFILRTHAYAIDPHVAKNMMSHVIKYGIHESADKLIRADIFPMHQTSGFAYDEPGGTTIYKRAEHSFKTTRIDKIETTKTKVNENGSWDSLTAHHSHVHCKELSSWICQFLKNKNEFIYDFGCGLGSYLKDLKESGFNNLIGYEADPPVRSAFDNIKTQDLTIPFEVDPKGSVISLEVGEHIPAELSEIYLNNICNNCNNYLIMSWAIKGQEGLGHINCLDNNEIISKIEKRGFNFLINETLEARKLIKDDCFWFKKSLIIFKK